MGMVPHADGDGPVHPELLQPVGWRTPVAERLHYTFQKWRVARSDSSGTPFNGATHDTATPSGGDTKRCQRPLGLHTRNPQVVFLLRNTEVQPTLDMASAMAPAAAGSSEDMYEVLGVTRDASEVQVRRAYRSALTRCHPDKGGDPQRFRAVQRAYDVLGDKAKREVYDRTGRVERSPQQEFVEAFAGGAFGDPLFTTQQQQQQPRVQSGPAADSGARAAFGASATSGSLADQIILRQRSGELHSHTAGFEAWLRARGEAGSTLFTAETVAEQFGVARNSYDAVQLPYRDVLQVQCHGSGAPQEVLSLEPATLPPQLEWGQVLVAWRFVPINPADVYTARLGGLYGSDTAPSVPYVAGHDGVGVVAKVGPGVKALCEGDVVLPGRPFLGTWATATLAQEKDLMRLPPDGLGLPLEVLAVGREMALAYKLLEGSGLKPGDGVLLNGATSTVGALLLQLGRLLRLRPVAVARPPQPSANNGSSIGNGSSKTAADGAGGGGEGRAPLVEGGEGAWERTVARLKALGAVEVLRDEGSLKAELDRRRFFARPRVGLDGVGGTSAARLAEALGEGGTVVVYGCMSGTAPVWPWQSFVFGGISVRGFNLRRWAQQLQQEQQGKTQAVVQQGPVDAKKQQQGQQQPQQQGGVVGVLASMAKLVSAGLLQVPYTEYDITEFKEALEHALDRGKGTKVLLRTNAEAGVQQGPRPIGGQQQQQETKGATDGARVKVAFVGETAAPPVVGSKGPGGKLGAGGEELGGGRPVVVTQAVV